MEVVEVLTLAELVKHTSPRWFHRIPIPGLQYNRKLWCVLVWGTPNTQRKECFHVILSWVVLLWQWPSQRDCVGHAMHSVHQYMFMFFSYIMWYVIFIHRVYTRFETIHVAGTYTILTQCPQFMQGNHALESSESCTMRSFSASKRLGDKVHLNSMVSQTSPRD